MSSLTVNTNLSALSAYNSLNATDMQESKAIGELSSGLSIQTAADGPAAYVTSQALTAQANGYQVAISNAQNGVSLIQTASGALNQISSILQTMNQLAISSANGATNDSASLAANQQEFAALQDEIDQIASTTSFGTTNLLDGTFSNQVLQVGAFDTSSQQITFSISSVSTDALGVGVSSPGTSGYTDMGGAVPASASAATGTVTFTLDGNAESVTLTATAGQDPTALAAAFQSQIGAQIGAGKVSVAIGSNGHLQFASDTKGTNSSLDVESMSNALVSDLGFNGSGFTTAAGTAGNGPVEVDTATHAQAAISAIQTAISSVDSIEASVGATQNELQAIGANLTVGQQNLSAASSQLVDVNMAQEMTVFSTDQILMQTGTAMLSQAQQAPNLVLKLI